MKKLCTYLAMFFTATAMYGGEDLSGSRPANCYVVTGAGEYSFNATVKGGSSDPIRDVQSAGIVWCDKPGLITGVRYEDGKVLLTADGQQGNAVVAVFSPQGEVLWSWHIWCRDKRPSDEMYLNYNWGRFVVMDAFLGSDASGEGATLYQWGRKDPFPAGGKVFVGDQAAEPVDFNIRFPAAQPIDGTPDRVVGHPATFILGDDRGNWFTRVNDTTQSLWGDSRGYCTDYISGGWSGPKSMYDPCPAGYRVANRHTFTNFTLSGDNSDKPYEFNVVKPWMDGYLFQNRAGDDIGVWYPSTPAKDARNGEVVKTERVNVWYSHPRDLHRIPGYAMLSCTPNSVKSNDRDGSATGRAVRCVKIDDAADLFSLRGEALWNVPRLTPPATPAINLSAAGTANCYIVHQAGNYTIDARVKGNSSQKVGKAVSAELLWCDVPCLLGNVKLNDDGSVGFCVHRMAGNGVICVKNAEGQILWSWHIWVSGEKVGEKVMYNHNGIPSTLLDRPLGAFSAEGEIYCMLYQWGRKDPFPSQDAAYAGTNSMTRRRFSDIYPAVKSSKTGDASRNNMNFVVQNPGVYVTSDSEFGSWMTRYDSTVPYLWGDPTGYAAECRGAGTWSGKKSIYDPCPPGYRVSNSGSFTALTSTGQSATDVSKYRITRPFDNGWYFKCNPGDDVGMWFPLSGWRAKDTGLPGAWGSRGALWHSNPTGSASEKMRRTMYASDNLMPESSETMACGNAVRCVKEQ